MKYKIFSIYKGRETPYSREYSETEVDEAEKLVKQLNKNRNVNDPYYHLSTIYEVIKERP